MPEAGRFGLGLADGVTNLYLLLAALFAASLDSTARSVDPGRPLNIDMHAEGRKVPADTKTPPLNLLDAPRLTDGSKPLGAAFVDLCVKLKTRVWNDHPRHLTDRECANTLER